MSHHLEMVSQTTTISTPVSPQPSSVSPLPSLHSSLLTTRQNTKSKSRRRCQQLYWRVFLPVEDAFNYASLRAQVRAPLHCQKMAPLSNLHSDHISMKCLLANLFWHAKSPLKRWKDGTRIHCPVTTRGMQRRLSADQGRPAVLSLRPPRRARGGSGARRQWV